MSTSSPHKVCTNLAVLPVWYCAPSETAVACNGCPQSQTSDVSQGSCENGFNALVLLPLVAAPGLFLPPPEGLPTLTIDNGEPGRYTPQPKPTPTPEPKSSSPSSTPSPTPTEESAPTVPCVKPTNKVADNARAEVTTKSLGGTATPVSQPPALVPSAMPFLPLQLDGGMGACGGGGTNGRYFNGGFYQFGNKFSHEDGLNALSQFCATHTKNGSMLGPDGTEAVDNKGVRHKAKVRSKPP